MQRVVDIEGLVVRFRRFRLGPIALQLPPQGSLGLAGANGAGKSTILSVRADLAVVLDRGVVRQSGSPRELARVDGLYRELLEAQLLEA